MGKLFWRFLLAFWGCLIIASLLAVGSLRLFDRVNQDAVLAEGPRARLLLDTAQVIMQLQGPDELARFLRRADSRQGRVLPVYAVNGAGDELLERSLPSNLSLSDRDDEGGKVSVLAPNGQSWTLFVLKRPHHGGPMPEHADHPKRSVGGVGLLVGLPPVAIVVVAAMAGLLFAVVLAYTYSRPFTRLKEGFASVAKGNLKTRLLKDKPRNDEVGELLQGFDRMAGELDRQITQQKVLLHDVSHELRSPLARLNLAAGLLRQSPAQLEVGLERIERETERLDHLIGQLLKLSRLESEAWQVEMAPTDLIELLENVLMDAQFEAEQKGVVLVAEEMPNTCRLTGNADAIHSALENVIRNAIRHTPAEGKVTIAVRQFAKAIEVSVQDEGGGLDEAVLPNLFEPFFKQGNHKGHGLGLAIVKKSVQLHGGHVSASNSGKGLLLTLNFMA